MLKYQDCWLFNSKGNSNKKNNNHYTTTINAQHHFTLHFPFCCCCCLINISINAAIYDFGQNNKYTYKKKRKLYENLKINSNYFITKSFSYLILRVIFDSNCFALCKNHQKLFSWLKSFLLFIIIFILLLFMLMALRLARFANALEFFVAFVVVVVLCVGCWCKVFKYEWKIQFKLLF